MFGATILSFKPFVDATKINKKSLSIILTFYDKYISKAGEQSYHRYSCPPNKCYTLVPYPPSIHLLKAMYKYREGNKPLYAIFGLVHITRCTSTSSEETRLWHTGHLISYPKIRIMKRGIDYISYLKGFIINFNVESPKKWSTGMEERSRRLDDPDNACNNDVLPLGRKESRKPAALWTVWEDGPGPELSSLSSSLEL